MKFLYLFLLALTLLVSSVPAQNAAAQLSGRITDPSGAIIPSAGVTVRNTETGGSHHTTSNDSGYFAVPSLDPGHYEVLIEQRGFRAMRRSGIQLHVNQALAIDFVLEIGDVAQTLEVNSDAPLLETTEGALGAVIDNAKVINLPLNGRNPFDLVLLTPGTQAYSRGVLPGNNIPLSNFSTNGGPPMTNDILLDGIPNTTIVQNQLVVVPSVDATQEFKVQSNSIKAEFGHTGGGVVNVSLKSGANQFHGVLFDFLRNDKLQANDWFSNRAGSPRAPFRFNQFGGVLGGRIVRDKTFFFLDYEGLRRTQGRTTILTVPRDDMRGGDFSPVQDSSGRPVSIFNPLSTRLNPDGSYVRDPFAGNRIPLSLMDPVALKMLSYWPHANLPGDPRTGANNFISSAGEQYGVNQFNTRIDHTLAQHQLFGRVSWNRSYVNPPNIFGNVANPSSGPQSFTEWNTGVNDTWTVRPTTVATFRLGFSRLHDFAEPYGRGFDITQLGFPASYATFQTARQFPQINVTGMLTPSPLGFGTSALGAVDSTTFSNRQNAYSAQSDATMVRGRHIVKFGADTRVYRVDGARADNGAGTFSFTPNFTQGPNPTLAGPTSGNAFASYLLGTAQTGSVAIMPTQDFQQSYAGLFAQDDIRITPKLTLNIGLRYELETSRTDRHDRLSFLDFTSPSPLQAPTLGRQLTGGLAFAAVNGAPRSQANTADNNWGPRFGLAYNAGPRLVLRGGYGMFYSPRAWLGIGQYGQIGFSATTPFVPSVNGFNPTNFLRDPFPNGYSTPTGSSLGLLTQVGQALAGPDRNQGSPDVQQWNFGLQTTLPGGFLFEPAYAGSKGSHLMQNLGFDQIPNQYLSMGNDLLRQVPNPFLGQIPANTTLGQATVSVGQLLRPYPQFTAFNTVHSTSGSSIYHSLQLRLERRFNSGFTLLVAYTFSKLIDQGAPGSQTAYMGENPSFQDLNNRRLERSLGSQNLAQHFVTSFVYELPFGPGKRFFSAARGPLGLLAGGWQLSGIVTLQDGIPLAITAASNPTLGALGSGTLRPDNNGHSAAKSGPVVDRLNSYFDTSVFSQPAPFHFGNTSRTLPDVRAPGIVDFDLSAIKNTRFKERYNLQFRAESFNTFNHPNFGLPNETFGSPGFGTITSINNSAPARIIQLALKLYF